MAGAAASRTPWHLWVVGVLAVIWASVPTYDWVMFKLEDADFLAGLPADWKAVVQEQPLWVEVAWFFAIWVQWPVQSCCSPGDAGRGPRLPSPPSPWRWTRPMWSS